MPDIIVINKLFSYTLIVKNTIKFLSFFIFIFLAVFIHASAITQERDILFEPVIQNSELKQLLFENSKRIPADFNYTSLINDDTDFLLVGEEHHDNTAARDVNLMIKNLSKVGLKYVATEFLLSSEQPLIDSYYKGEITYPELKKKCKLKGRSFVAEIAKRYRIKTIGLDLPQAHEDYLWAMSAEGLTARNDAWTDKLLSLKQKAPDALILVHGGSLHTATFSKYYPTVAQMLRKHNMKTKTVEFVSSGDSLWKKLNINSNYDLLFTIPKELKKYIQADYVIWSTDSDYSKEDKAELKKISEQNSEKFMKDEIFSDGCLLDHDNAFCKVVIRGSRVKNK